jgi:hypothetical protein
MEEDREPVISLLTERGSAEAPMLRPDLVLEIVARRERGEGIKRIGRELGVDRKTVKHWLRLSAWPPREAQRRKRQLDRFAEFIERRAPESKLAYDFDRLAVAVTARTLGSTPLP